MQARQSGGRAGCGAAAAVRVEAAAECGAGGGVGQGQGLCAPVAPDLVSDGGAWGAAAAARRRVCVCATGLGEWVGPGADENILCREQGWLALDKFREAKNFFRELEAGR